MQMWIAGVKRSKSSLSVGEGEVSGLGHVKVESIVEG